MIRNSQQAQGESNTKKAHSPLQVEVTEHQLIEP
jgi:hypothetical protein